MENRDKSSDKQVVSEPKTSVWRAVVKEVIIFAIIAFGIVFPFRMFVAEPYIVDGASMDPTFKTGDYLIVDKLSYELGHIERNSVIVFKYPNDTSKNFIKRIIGMPGDTVTVSGNQITIVNKDNPKGFNVDDSYVTHPCLAGNTSCISSFTQTLGTDEYFVMGDNRAESFDSRSWGVLPRKDMLGRPLLRLFPLSKIGFLPGNDKVK